MTVALDTQDCDTNADTDDSSTSNFNNHANTNTINDSVFPTTIAELKFNSSDPDLQLTTSIYRTISSLRKSTLSIHNRLQSVLQDSKFVLEYREDNYPSFPLYANERCGSWYIPPSVKSGSAYFKSTDGHHGQWDFSLRRLNLDFLKAVGVHGGIVLVDSTRRGKRLPDALRRTVPIWIAVWNLVLFGQTPSSRAANGGSETGKWANSNFCNGKLQSCGLERNEVAQIEARIEEWVNRLEALGLDVETLRGYVKKPIRCVWVVQGEDQEILPDGWNDQIHDYEVNDEVHWNTIILCSASRRVLGTEMSEDGYIQGAGDDSEGWSQGLTANIFWEFKRELMTISEGELPVVIRDLVARGKENSRPTEGVRVEPTKNLFLAAGKLSDINTSVQQQYDLIVICDGLTATLMSEESPKLLCLGCRKGKLGSKDLRTKLIKAKEHIFRVLSGNGPANILIMCENGRDLSVGAMVAILCLFYNANGDFSINNPTLSIDKHLIKQRLAWITSCKPDANPSRSTLQAVNSFLMDRPP